MNDTDDIARVVTLLVVVALVATPAVAGVAHAADAAGASTGAQPPKPTFEVALQQSGAATVTLQLTYDLDSDAERTAFRSLQNDSDARRAAKQRFADRLRSVAAAAENATGRSMSITDAAITLRTTDGTGVVELSVTWKGLAATKNGKLVVTEPFASGFRPDQRFVVTVPDGYSVASVSPSADSAGDGRLVWAAGTDLTGFKLVASPSDGSGGPGNGSSPTDTQTPTVPGFGPAAALAALAAAALLMRRR